MMSGLQQFLHTLDFSLYTTLNEAKRIMYLFTMAIYTCSLTVFNQPSSQIQTELNNI